MGDLRYRLSLTILNIFFPPLALLIVCGPDMTFAVNCLLYIFAIIPSHIHGLYVSCVYFHRRRKVSCIRSLSLSLSLSTSMGVEYLPTKNNAT